MNTDLFNSINASAQMHLDEIQLNELKKKKKKREKRRKLEAVRCAVISISVTVGFFAICDFLWFLATRIGA
jgi:hypothetical protein